MDIYSNILYVKEAFAALSHLAQRAALTNKYRPETACIIGNYYSLKGQHEKVGPVYLEDANQTGGHPAFARTPGVKPTQAVMYFRRALKLDQACLSAWTLMGHEYVEMKNPPAAIGAGDLALFLCQRSSRSNAGQRCVLTSAPYAEAYRRAVDLNPRDYRAWYGLGQTYELLHMPYYALFYFRWCEIDLVGTNAVFWREWA